MKREGEINKLREPHKSTVNSNPTFVARFFSLKMQLCLFESHFASRLLVLLRCFKMPTRGRCTRGLKARCRCIAVLIESYAVPDVMRSQKCMKSGSFANQLLFKRIVNPIWFGGAILPRGLILTTQLGE
jgi:hypothetical protein